MTWKIHFVLRAIYRSVPFRHKLRGLLHKKQAPRWVAATDDWALTQSFSIISLLKEVGRDPRGRHILELGTGWHPIAPILLSLAGAASIHTIDIEPCLDLEHLTAMARGLEPKSGLIAEKLEIPEENVRATLGSLTHKNLEENFAALRIVYFPNHDITSGAPEKKEYDIVYSRAVLEHIPEENLEPICAAVRHMLKDEGCSLHIIDNSDHWEHVDKGISRLHFLSFSDFVNTIVNAFNPQDFQNRLRNSEYITLFERAGFTLLIDRPEVDAKALEDLTRMHLHPRFQRMEPEDLATITSYLVFGKTTSRTAVIRG